VTTPPQPDLESATASVASHLPQGWTVARIEDGQLPTGHYWGDWGANYTGPRGRHLVLLGPGTVNVCWKDAAGTWRNDAVARESLDVWLMPENYSESLWSRINPHAPPTPWLLSSRGGIQLYAMPSHEVVDQKRFDAILRAALEVDWPRSPGRTGEVSWGDWRGKLVLVATRSTERH